ncbi:MAG: hypothetical protein K5883_06240 [Pseudobutyrivibrio sp.]|uniref:hypothetical protein n=1 Tax=Pseudobutyrivibrio sp. OR37 TaxID=1798186 RepID=UPI0008E900C1|nr:hypothetical protein [Pseudobutyrivibrio sp. OR37]MCR4831039.1 hypothetical protein [Pseudobutyrivibrio sp.]SFH74286.1 hypothetical protein SAMN04487830_1078 [Pseudobutyrivibrio sp. OR37]
MNAFIRLRDDIRKFILSREMLFIKIWSAIVAFVGLICIKVNFGYNKTVSQTWLLIVIALLCAFFPIQGVSVVLTIVLLLDLLELSTEAAVVALALIVASYLVCAYFRSKNTYNTVVVPICYSFHSPFVIALGAGLLSSINELCSVICGSVTAYYLHIVKDNAAAIIDETSDVSVISLLNEQMLKGRMFYFFLAAMTSMFLIVYMLRQSKINMSWIVANLAGVAVEFIIMLTGYLLTSQKTEVPGLMLGNLIVIIVGVLLNYFILDLDYSRIEKVQFEDDDYYYYVTAVPKIRIAEEEKEIKKI